MINQKSLEAVKTAAYRSHFCRPLYDSYSFGKIPATILSLLTGEKQDTLPVDCFSQRQFNQESYDCVILFFIDGFGWRFFEKYAPQFPFLSRFIDQGIASKITALFPSTTAAHVTCINTDLIPAQTGIYEWFYYEPQADHVIAPLIFSFAGDKKNGTLKDVGLTGELLFPFSTFYQTLQSKGIRSKVFQQTNLVGSAYSNAMFKGAEQVPWASFEEGLKSLNAACQARGKEKAYFYFYFGEIDAQGHRHGTDSLEFHLAVENCFVSLEHFFSEQDAKKTKTAYLLVADHGMTGVEPKETFYLNEHYPEIENQIKRNRKGNLIVPAGSCRDFFLHIKDECLTQSQERLQQLLNTRALVVKTEQLIKEGFFGSQPPSNRLLERVGNLVILPYSQEAVWWRVKHRFEQHFYGAHGGLTPAEMEIPFLFLDLDEA